MSFERGTVIAGKYRVDRVIGQGGMGVVLAAKHLGLDELVAVKLIHQERADSADALARFQREARAAARIKNEHVARVLDVDRLHDGTPYIVMEYIDGTDLHAHVNRRGPLPFDEAASYIIQACEGLAEAHALGMVHRDLKLKNLFLTKRRDGRALIKVIDFGVVKFTVADDPELTQQLGIDGRRLARDATLTGASALVGSVHYMAPEQIRASNIVDPQADVWSLGVCLYAMLAARLPFDGEVIADVCAAIQGRPYEDIRQHAPMVPPQMAAALERALEKDVRRRFVNVAELASALAPFGSDPAAPSRIETILQSSVSSAPRSLPPPPVDVFGATITSDAPFAKGRAESTMDAAAVGSMDPIKSFAPPKKRSPWLTVALVLLGAGGTFAVWQSRQPTAATITPVVASPPPPPPAVETPPPPPAPTPSAVATPAQQPAPAPAPPPAPTGTPRATKHRSTAKPASPGPAPAPKPEASNAYDHF